NVDCRILEATVSNELFEKIYYVCRHPEKNIAIVDTNKYFLNCKMLSSCGGAIELIQNTKIQNNYARTIILYKLEKERRTYKLCFLERKTMADLIITVRKKRKRYKVEVVSYGYY
ncbi:MAG: hypothetical protein WCR52_23540, partial [Bacteroidota bacterium]